MAEGLPARAWVATLKVLHSAGIRFFNGFVDGVPSPYHLVLFPNPKGTLIRGEVHITSWQGVPR